MKIRHGLALLLLVSGSLWAADVPDKINYQGVLRKGDETRLPAGIQNVKFRLYNEANVASASWGREIPVLLDTNGLFNVTLSDDIGSALTNGVLSRVMADNPQLFIGLSVGSAEEIKPRQELLSVPYALLAGNVKSAASNFTVKGTITVDGMAMLTGGVTAASVQVGDGDGMTFTNSHLRIADDVRVNGNVVLDYNLNVAGNTTLTNLTVTGPLVAEKGVQIGEANFFATSGEEELRIVRGNVTVTNGNPNIEHSNGLGWSNGGNPTSGKYTIAFDQPFSGVPTVTANVWGSKTNLVYVAVVESITTNNFVLYTYGLNNVATELSFTFIAVGPR